MGDGAGSIIVAVLAFVVGSFALIGAVVWLYSAQSAKRRQGEGALARRNKE